MSIQLRNDTDHGSSGNSDSGEAAPHITEFTLDEIQAMKSTSSNMVVFNSEEGSQDEFSLKGHVSTLWSLTPKDTAEYRQAVKNRQLSAATRVRTVKSVDSKTVFEHSQSVQQEIDFVSPAYVSDRKRDGDPGMATGGGGGGRRQRGEKATEKELKQLTKKLLDVFADQECLTFKQINASCQAHEQDLRDLLKKYCDYHSKGALKSNYELKAEYKGSLSAK